MENKKKVLSLTGSIVEEIIYYLILIPLIIIAFMIIYQQITEPEKIPNVFGYKIFMIMDDLMCKDIEYGDLVITKNVDTNKLQIGDMIAFRNGNDTVTIHKIIGIKNELKPNESLEEENLKIFEMETRENELSDTKYVSETKVEGMIKKKIPILGLVILFIQQPLALFTIICIILIIGLICLYIAQELDKKDEIRLQEMKKINNMNTNKNTNDEVKEEHKKIIKVKSTEEKIL